MGRARRAWCSPAVLAVLVGSPGLHCVFARKMKSVGKGCFGTCEFAIELNQEHQFEKLKRRISHCSVAYSKGRSNSRLNDTRAYIEANG